MDYRENHPYYKKDFYVFVCILHNQGVSGLISWVIISVKYIRQMHHYERHCEELCDEAISSSTSLHEREMQIPHLCSE